MPRVGDKSKYRVKYVKHFPFKNGTATSFSFGEKIKNSEPTAYQNYSFVVWDNLDLMDNDDVNILSIDSIEVNYKNGKMYVNLSGKVNVIQTETAQYAEETPPVFQQQETKGEGFIDEFNLNLDI